MYEQETIMVQRRWEREDMFAKRRMDYRERFRRQSHKDLCLVTCFYTLALGLSSYSQCLHCGVTLVMIGLYAILVWLAVSAKRE